MNSNYEDLSSLSVNGLLGMLQSNKPAVVTEVLSLIKQEFPKVKDKWLINGLVDYFFYSKSQKLLDLIISCDSRHSKYLMENIADGLKHKDKFSYTTLLLYAVSQDPLPLWVYKIPDHLIIKELLLSIDPYKEKDPSVVVSALMVFVILLPAMPQSFIAHLSKLLESFGLLLHHPPPKSEMKYYLQIAICCFFQRLYGLYPTKLVSFLRHQHSVKPSTLGWYEKTLFPMLEKVRFHPLIITELKETQSFNRWQGKSRNDVMQECAQFSLDPYYENPDVVSFSMNFLNGANVDLSSQSKSVNLSERRNFYAIRRSNSSLNQSASVNVLYQTSMHEKPNEIFTETAEEATPDIALSAKNSSLFHNENNNVKEERSRSSSAQSWFSSSFKKQNLSNLMDTAVENLSSHSVSKKFVNMKPSKEATGSDVSVKDEQTNNAEFENMRLRKTSIYEDKTIEANRNDLILSLGIENIEEENDRDSEVSDDDEEDSEGLGMPCHSSWNELLKTVNTKRLRFLSQCGPPPDLGSLAGSLSTSPSSPVKSNVQNTPEIMRKSKSYPNLADKLKYIGTSLSVSPVRAPVETIDETTQTEEVEVIDPYEMLLKSLIRIPNELKQEQMKLEQEPTSQEMLDMVIRNEIDKDWIPCINGTANGTIDVQTKSSFKQQLRCLYTLYKFEQFKKDKFSNRNRFILGKMSESIHQDEKVKSWSYHEEFLENENRELKAKIQDLENRNRKQEELLKEMAHISRVANIENAKDLFFKQKDSIEELCKKLQNTKLVLDSKIQQSEASLTEATRQLKSQTKHYATNKALRKRIHTLNKQVLVLGELAFNLDHRLSLHRNPEQMPINYELEVHREELSKNAALLEQRNREYHNDYVSAYYHVLQLQNEVDELKEHIKSQQIQVYSNDLSCKEKCELLEKRNIELSCITRDFDEECLQYIEQLDEVPVAKCTSLLNASCEQQWPHGNI